MFKNREFRVRMVKTDPADGEIQDEINLQIDPQKIVQAAKDVITHTAIAFVGAYAARATMITIHQVIVLRVERKFR